MEYKKQHWVPQSYLQAWCDPDIPEGQSSYVWVFSVDGTNAKRKDPKNIFYESDMYTIHLNDGTRVLDIEHGLSGLEESFANVRRNVLDKRKKLLADDRLIILAFIAATFCRTKSRRNHMKEQWAGILDLGLKIKEQMKSATLEQRKAMASISSSSPKEKGLSLKDVKKLAEQPLQETLISSIAVQTELLYPMYLSFLLTKEDPGYITSDDPCVWFDPEAYKRPPFYRSPGLAYKSIEITLPISPNIMAFLTWHPLDLYINVEDIIVDDLNRRTRFYAGEHFVVRRNVTKKIWFEPGKPFDDW